MRLAVLLLYGVLGSVPAAAPTVRAAPTVQADGRLRWVEVELRGPLEECRHVASGGEVTRLSGDLRAGELRRRPVPVTSLPGAALPEWECGTGAGSGGARSLEWGTATETWNAVPRGLRARTRPPLEAPRPRLSVAGWLVLGAAGVLFLALRRSRAGLLATGAAAALALCLVGAAEDRGGAEERVVYEGQDDGDSWLVVTARIGRLDVPPGCVRLETVPAHAPLTFEVDLARAETEGATAASAPGAGIVGFEWGPAPDLRRDANGFRAVAEAWTRDEAGEWRHHGAWPAGAPLGPGRADPSRPPGWLAAGLPQGRSVLIGRLGTAGHWLRWVGLE